MNEDQLADLALREREEELKVGARALTRRLKDLEARGATLRQHFEAMEDPYVLAEEMEELQEGIYACRWGLYELTANALGGGYIAADVAHWCQRALEMKATHPRLDQALLMDLVHVRKVPNAPLRAGFARVTEGATDEDVDAKASRVAVKTHDTLRAIERAHGEDYGSGGLVIGGTPQGRTLRRWLGVETCPGRGDHPATLRLFVRYEQAEALASALDLSPHQAGI